MSKVQYTFDCGCALLEDGSRSWCPTCAEGGAKLGAEERLSSDRAWAADQISDLLTAWEAQSARIEALEGCVRLARCRMRHILETASAGMTRAEVKMTQDVVAQCDALLPPVPDPRSGPDGPVADHVDGYKILPGEEDWNQPEEKESGETELAQIKMDQRAHYIDKEEVNGESEED